MPVPSLMVFTNNGLTISLALPCACRPLIGNLLRTRPITASKIVSDNRKGVLYGLRMRGCYMVDKLAYSQALRVSFILVTSCGRMIFQANIL
jgi:hypothetical protein